MFARPGPEGRGPRRAGVAGGAYTAASRPSDEGGGMSSSSSGTWMSVRGFSGAFDFADFDFPDALGGLGALAGASASAAARASRGASLWAAAGGPGWLGMKRETQS